MDSQALPQYKGPLPQPESRAKQQRDRAQKEHEGGFQPIPFAKEVWSRFNEDNGPLISAALSFFTLISLVPIMLVAVAIFGYFMTGADARDRVISFLFEFMPALGQTSEMRSEVMNTISGILKSAAAGPKELSAIAGVLGLIWTGLSLFRNMETAFAIVFEAKSRRGFFKSILTAVIAMSFIGLLLLSSIAVTALVSVVQTYFPNLPLISTSSIFEVIGFLISILLTFGMFFAIYKIIPNAKIQTKAALIGAGFATVFFEIAKYGFGWYVSNFGNFNKTYGALGMVIFLITWTLYSYMIMLLGSEVADVYSDVVLQEPAVEEQAEGEPVQAPATA
ncbi:MAG: YihY/virulence factor BrkB family protein [Armatimonadetes bacterium]|nr:YihY/virulence factor BrkB family protein [Armatimonadota bacterium]